MNFAALPVAILMFLLPGYAWMLLSGLTKRLGVLGSITFSFILSVCLVSSTSAFLSLLTSSYLVYAILGATILPVVVIATYFWRQGFTRPAVPTKSVPLLFLVCLVVYVAFLYALFWSTPFYPTAPATDALAHAELTQNISNGYGRNMLLHGSYPVGLHFAAAILMTLLGTDALLSLRLLVSSVLLSILALIFVSAQFVFGNRTVPALVTAVGAFVLPVDAMQLVLIGTFPNILGDAVVLASAVLLFSYVRKPSRLLGLTLSLVGVAGMLIHSSFLLFIAVLWLILLFTFMLFRKCREPLLYMQACLYSALGVGLVVLVALSFVRGNVERLLAAYPIAQFVGGATVIQLFENLLVVYSALAFNVLFFIKPLNIVAIVVGMILVGLRGRRSFGEVFVAGWFLILVILSFFSGETDRFVLFSMLPATFLVGNLLGKMGQQFLMDSWHVNRNFVLGVSLLVLVMFGGFLPLVGTAFNPTSRVHEQDVFASMQWLRYNNCPAVASVGLEIDFRYLQILAGVPYAGSLPTGATPDELLRESTAMQFRCVVVQTTNPNFPLFELNPAFQEKYHNEEVAIFFITK
jgi:hypothetical protein